MEAAGPLMLHWLEGLEGPTTQASEPSTVAGLSQVLMADASQPTMATVTQLPMAGVRQPPLSGSRFVARCKHPACIQPELVSGVVKAEWWSHHRNARDRANQRQYIIPCYPLCHYLYVKDMRIHWHVWDRE